MFYANRSPWRLCPKYSSFTFPAVERRTFLDIPNWDESEGINIVTNSIQRDLAENKLKKDEIPYYFPFAAIVFCDRGEFKVKIMVKVLTALKMGC